MDKILAALLAKLIEAADAQAGAYLQVAGLAPDPDLTPFAFSVMAGGTVPTLGSGATLTLDWAIGGIGEFVLTEVRARSTGLASVQVSGTSLPNNQLFNAPAVIGTLCAGGNPYRLPAPIRLSKQAAGKVVFTDLSGAANTADLLLIGYLNKTK
jgi:hypothetical protein